MAIIHTVNGPANVGDDTIARILAPYPGQPFTTIFGPLNAAIETVDTPESIIVQLHINPALALLTTPVGTRVWVKPLDSVVTGIFPPPPPLPPDPGFPRFPVGCVLQVAGHLQALKENAQQAAAILSALGWHHHIGFQGLDVEREVVPDSELDVYAGPPDAKEYSPW